MLSLMMRGVVTVTALCLFGSTAAPGACWSYTDTPNTPSLVRELVIPATPAPQDWIVKTQCTADVLSSPGGDWLITASHCLPVVGDTVEAGDRAFTIIDIVDSPDDSQASDVALLRVDGDIEAAAGGGFVVGTAPRVGSQISVYGYAWYSDQVTGCDDLDVADQEGFPQVSGCDLPGGVSGGAWFTPDGVLHGVTGGLEWGGDEEDVTYTSAFTDETVAWVASVTQG